MQRGVKILSTEVWNNLWDCLSFYHLWVIQKACSPARNTCMAPCNVFSSLCLISRKVVFNAVLKLSWITWDGESLMRMVEFPPNAAICEKSDQAKSSSLSQGNNLFFQNQKIFVRGFFSLPPSHPHLLCVRAQDSMRSIVGERKELCGGYVHVHMPASFQILVRVRLVFI